MTPSGPKDARAARAVNEGTPAASDDHANAPSAVGAREPSREQSREENREPTREQREQSAHEDMALVRRVRAGDQAAFRALFDKYHRRVYAVALGVVKNPSDARDVVQDAFVKVHRHLDGFQGASSFYTWLYRITMNLAIDQTRRKKVARSVDYDDALHRDDELNDPHHLKPQYGGSEPAKTLSRKELASKIQGALGTLPEYHRQAILLREVEGLSYEEIAKIMKVPKGTIMSRLFHARRKMQSALADYVDGELKPQDEVDDGSKAR